MNNLNKVKERTLSGKKYNEKKKKKYKFIKK